MVLFFYSVGQLVMVRFADAGARTAALGGSMASYTARVVVLGLVLLLYARFADRLPVAARWSCSCRPSRSWSAGWSSRCIVFSRLRISVYDTEYADAARARDRPAVSASAHDGHVPRLLA